MRKEPTVNSREPTVEAYGGVSGRVLREAMSGASLVTGLSLIISLGTLSYIMSKFHADDAFAVLLHLVVIGALARFAVNGYAGEWGGTVFSSRGGTWMETGSVGLRYLALSLVWLLPAVLLGWRPDTVNAAIGEAFLGGGSKWLILTCFVGMVIALSPPVFLIVSVGAMRFRDIVDPEHWRTLFRGRGGDLFLIYALYLGALTMTAIIVLPFLVSVAAKSQDWATVMGLGCLAFAGGLAVNLLGRLCGFFAATAFPAGDVTGEAVEAGPGPDRTMPAVAPPGRTPSPVSDMVPGLIPGLAQDPEVADARPAAVAALTPSPAEGDPVDGAPEDHAPGKTPLLEAGARVDALARRFDAEPEGVIKELMDLRDQCAPNPQVLHFLSLCLLRAGHIESSLNVALEALPLCLGRGAIRLASELFAAHLRNADRMGLAPDVVLNIADELRRLGDLPASERAYMKVLGADAGENRALKGLLQLAENRLQAQSYAEASRIYEVLIERCENSPFAVHMHEGLAEARRRMAKAS
jgi:hypothetical protein